MFGPFLLKKIENFNFFFEKFQKSLKINEKSMKTFSGIKSDGRNGKSNLELTIRARANPAFVAAVCAAKRQKESAFSTRR